MSTDAVETTKPRRTRKILAWLGFLLLVWAAAAYVIIPAVWEHYIYEHPLFDASPRITQTGDGHPGDPLNVALIGSKEQIEKIMAAAKWYPAAALGLDSDIKIAVDTVLSRPDEHAPVSSLYLFGRKEDLAFEQPVGDSPRHRHHVRLWKTEHFGPDGEPQWIGSAVYDEGVGLSRTTGQITHVTAANVDAERDYLFQCLEGTGELAEHYIEFDFHTQLSGKNGGGDPWKTDGNLYVGIIKESGMPGTK